MADYFTPLPDWKKIPLIAATDHLFDVVTSTPEGRARLEAKKAQLRAEGRLPKEDGHGA